MIPFKLPDWFPKMVEIPIRLFGEDYLYIGTEDRKAEPMKPTIEQIAYGKPRLKIALCGLSTIDLQTKVQINGVDHAGSAAHVCALTKGNHEVCICACGHRWVKNVK